MTLTPGPAPTDSGENSKPETIIEESEDKDPEK